MYQENPEFQIKLECKLPTKSDLVDEAIRAVTRPSLPMITENQLYISTKHYI